jgi:hypothetical protein
MSSKPAPQESFVQLWAGENPALHDALLEELEESGIVYADKMFGADGVAPDPLPIDSKPRFGFEVAVHHSDLPAAEEILEELLSEGDLADVELPAEDEAPADEPQSSGTAEEPSVSLWAGSDRRVIEFLTAALEENEIPLRVENEGELTVVYVPPSSAKRAREIVREISEGIPPE